MYGSSLDVDYSVKSVFIGSAEAGKSTILSMTCQNEPLSFTNTYIATIGVDFKVKIENLPDQRSVKHVIWEAAGQERFRALTSSYYRGANVIVLFIDLSKEPLDVQKDAEEFLEEINCFAVSRSKVPVCIIGNKADLADSSYPQIQNNVETNREYLKTLTLESTNATIQGVFVTSAKKNNDDRYNQRIDCSDNNVHSLDTVMSTVRAIGVDHAILNNNPKNLNNQKKLVVPQSNNISPPLLSNLNDKFFTVRTLREIATQKYKSTGFFGRRSKAMKNLDDLLRDKNDTDQIQGGYIVACLGDRGCFFSKQRTIEEHLFRNSDPKSGTGKVFTEIYKSMTNGGN